MNISRMTATRVSTVITRKEDEDREEGEKGKETGNGGWTKSLHPL